MGCREQRLDIENNSGNSSASSSTSSSGIKHRSATSVKGTKVTRNPHRTLLFLLRLSLTVVIFSSTQLLVNSETVDSVRHSTRAVNSKKNLNRTEMPLKGRRTTSNPPPNHFVDHIRREIERPKSTSRDQSSSLKITRYYKLYNRCSHRHLRIAGRHVDAAAMLNDRFNELAVQTDSFHSHLTIQSKHTRDYLCLNSKGKLTVKHSAGKDRKCIFRELHSVNQFTEFQSVANPTWFLGFGRKGQKLQAENRTKHPKCFQFLKTDFPYVGTGDGRLRQAGTSRNRQESSGPKIDVGKLYANLDRQSRQSRPTEVSK